MQVPNSSAVPAFIKRLILFIKIWCSLGFHRLVPKRANTCLLGIIWTLVCHSVSFTLSVYRNCNQDPGAFPTHKLTVNGCSSNVISQHVARTHFGFLKSGTAPLSWVELHTLNTTGWGMRGPHHLTKKKKKKNSNWHSDHSISCPPVPQPPQCATRLLLAENNTCKWDNRLMSRYSSPPPPVYSAFSLNPLHLSTNSPFSPLSSCSSCYTSHCAEQSVV